MQTPFLVRAVPVDDMGRRIERAHPLDYLARSHRIGDNHIDGKCEAALQSRAVSRLRRRYREALTRGLSGPAGLEAATRPIVTNCVAAVTALASEELGV